MPPTLNLSTAALQAVYDEASGEVMVMTKQGLRTATQLGLTFTGGGAGGGDASAANQEAVLAPSLTPGTAPAKATAISGIYTATTPSLTTGQAVGVQVDERGSQRVRIHMTNFTGADGIANTTLAGVNGSADGTGGTRVQAMANYVFNGATWDRIRGDAFGLRMQPAQRAGTNRSKAVTNTSSEVIPANANSWFLANDSAADIWINFGTAASATPGSTDGSFKLRPGERLSSADITDTRAINAIVATGTADIKAHST
jgi:hypothetical protein